MNWCKQPDVGLPKPDLVIYLTLSQEEAARRGGFGTERYERTEFQNKVAENFEAIREKDWKVSFQRLRLYIRKSTTNPDSFNVSETFWKYFST